MFQPLCGYVLDVLGLRLGFAIFAIAWSLISMAHALAHNWQRWPGCAAARAPGPGRGLGQPGRYEGDRGMVSRPASAAWPAASSTSGLRRVDARAALVAWAILSYDWQTAFVITGRSGSSGRALAPLLRHARPAPRAALPEKPSSSWRARSGTSPAAPPVAARHPAPAQLLGHCPAALPGRPHVGHADVWVPLYLSQVRTSTSADRDVRLDAVPGRGYRVLRRRHDQPLLAAARECR